MDTLLSRSDPVPPLRSRVFLGVRAQAAPGFASEQARVAAAGAEALCDGEGDGECRLSSVYKHPCPRRGEDTTTENAEYLQLGTVFKMLEEVLL